MVNILLSASDHQITRDLVIQYQQIVYKQRDEIPKKYTSVRLAICLYQQEVNIASTQNHNKKII